MFNLLEGDGVIENIYHLLWTKDSIFGTDPSVVIPHTILYKYQKPCYWYFTSKDENKLKKKSSMKLTNEHIREVFTKKISKSGIVAYYIYKKFSHTSKYEIDIDRQNFHLINVSTLGANPTNTKNDNKEGLYIIEYFDLNKLTDFLTNKITLDDGILQKFEDPKGEYNTTIRLIWSPKLCIFEKKTNMRNIFDTRYNLYERAVTYDGEEFQTRTEAIRGNNIPDRIERIGMSIASHIANITLERIKIVRMVLNFKVTRDDKIIFLWCSSLRIDNSLDKKKEAFESYKEPDINKIKIYVPDNINMFKYSNSNKPIQPLKDSQCLNCEFKVESYKLYEICFKTLIESHENRKRDKNYFKIFENINMSKNLLFYLFILACSGIEIMPFIENKTLEAVDKNKKKNFRNLLIPKVINAIYPKMKYEDYLTLKTDSIFNSKNTYVCESCFLDLTRYCYILGSNTENFLKTIRPNLSNVKSKYMDNNFYAFKTASESAYNLSKGKKSECEFKSSLKGSTGRNSNKKNELSYEFDRMQSNKLKEMILKKKGENVNNSAVTEFDSRYNSASKNMPNIKSIKY